MKNLNIVYANTIDYNHPLQQRPQHIMNELAKRGHNVMWVNQTQQDDKFRTKVNENLTIYHNWEKFANKFKDNIDIYFSSWSHRWIDIDKLNPKKVIYDSLDLFPQNESQEKNMVDKSDVILTTAKGLYDYHKKHTDKPILMCENGCFSKYRNVNYEIPNDLKNIVKKDEPILLFSGALSLDPINGWVDLELLRVITKRYRIFVVGMPWGINQEFINKNYDIFKNVIYLGVKNYEELQAYYSHCTVNLLPFKRCQTADYSFPLKTIEGCNHGKICVSSNIPVSIELNNEFPNAVLISETYNKFMNNIKLAIKKQREESIEEECYKLADKHEWTKKVDIIENIINKEI